jgi:signal peptidase I
MTERRVFWSFMAMGGAATLAGLYLFGGFVFSALFAQPRAYTVGSMSMEPTLREGERFLSQVARTDHLKRGDVVMVKVDKGDRSMEYVVRIAAKAGDKVELRNGVVVINDRPVNQTAPSQESRDTMAGVVTYVRVRERFPQEKQPHEIYDERLSSGDNFGPATVPKGHFFLLGDNRDNSNDSRFPAETYGLGMVEANRITGRASSIYWSDDSSRIGKSVH